MEFPITIAFNMRERKIGCVLMQAALGATLRPSLVSRYFESDRWELSPVNCRLYTIKNQEEFDKMVEITNNQ